MVPTPSKIRSMLQQAMDFFGLSIPWEVTVVENIKGEGEETLVFASVNCAHGHYAHFLLNRNMASDMRSKRGLIVGSTLIHEVIHVFQWALDAPQERAFADDDPVGAMVQEIRENQVEKLAWALLPHVYPDLDPEEDLFYVEEATTQLHGFDATIPGGSEPFRTGSN